MFLNSIASYSLPCYNFLLRVDIEKKNWLYLPPSWYRGREARLSSAKAATAVRICSVPLKLRKELFLCLLIPTAIFGSISHIRKVVTHIFYNITPHIVKVIIKHIINTGLANPPCFLANFFFQLSCCPTRIT